MADTETYVMTDDPKRSVKAYQWTGPGSLNVPGEGGFGTEADEGDYVVVDRDGKEAVVRKHVFEHSYQKKG
jgi:hypothetical protein